MLEITSLSKTYRGGIRAVNAVDLRAGAGIYGLLGANGAGKSTLMRIVATLQRPDSGSVRLDGQDVFADVLLTRHRLGYLPQELGTHPRVTAREVLEYLIGLKGLAAGRARKDLAMGQLARVGLTDVAERRLETFSGGMRQRFGIAAATLGDPRLIIVDEPTAGLDPTERRRFQALLAELAHDRILLLSSHIVEDIAGLCSNMALMHEGAVVNDGAIFTGESAVPALTRHEVSATGVLTAGETVNFTGQGATFMSNGVTFVSPTQALLSIDAEAKAVLWDPTEMAITGTIDLGVIEKDGLAGKALIGVGVLRDGLVYMPVAWADGVAQKYSEKMAVAIVNPTTKAVDGFIEDDRCNFSDGARLGPDGAIYVMGTNYTNLLTLYGVETRNTCLLRILPGQKVFDPDYHLEFPNVLDGRQAVRFYFVGDYAYAAAQYPEHVTSPGTSTRELNLKPWRFPLDGSGTGTEISDVPFSSAFVSTAHVVGNDLYIAANLAADDVSRNAVYKLTGGSTSATKVFEVDGLLRGLTRVK